MNLKAVIFDLDGTLIDSMGIWKDIDGIFLNKRNITVPDDLFNDLNSGNSFREVAIYFKERFELKESVDEIMREWNETVLDFYTDKIPLREGAYELIQLLARNNIKLAIGTSNSRQLTEAVLESTKVRKFFDSIQCGCELTKGKPNPDIYLEVLKDLSVNPTESFVIEDSLPGVLAAKNAEIPTIAIHDVHSVSHYHEILSTADYYFRDHWQILDLFKSIIFT